MTLQEKRDAAAKFLGEAKAIKTVADDAKRGMSVEEKTKFDELLGQHDQLNTEIENEETELRDKALRAREEAANKSRTLVPIENPSGRSTTQEVEITHSCKTMRAFKNTPEGRKQAFYAGRWMLGLMQPSNESHKRWVRDHGMEYRVATEAINTAGGYLVPIQMEQAIIDLRETYGTFRQWARVLPMTSDQATVPIRVSGQTAYFVGENDAPTASDKAWNQANLVAKTCAIESRYSSNLSEDAIINIADDLTQDAAQCLAAKEDACGWNGDGTSTYGGITGLRTKIILAAHSASVSAAVTAAHDTLPELDATDLITAMGKLPGYVRNPKWYCSNAFYMGVLLRLAGALTGNTTQTIQQGINRNYLGFPVVIDPTLPASTTTDYTGLAIAFFGDISLSTLFGDRRGISVMVDPYSLSSYLQTKLVWSERFDIVNHSLGDTTTSGPVIALTGGSG